MCHWCVHIVSVHVCRMEGGSIFKVIGHNNCAVDIYLCKSPRGVCSLEILHCHGGLLIAAAFLIPETVEALIFGNALHSKITVVKIKLMNQT